MRNIDTDKEHYLIKELKKSDTHAFNELFYAYSSKLYHFAYNYLKSKEEAEELVQEVFFRIWNKRGDIKEEYDFSSYLFTIAYNYIKKYFRSKALLNRYMEFNQEQVTEEDINYGSLKKLVDKLVFEMPEKRRMVFIKSRYEGKNAKEIATEMNLSQSTVENHLNMALNFLRKHLTEENLAGILFFWLFFR